MKKNLLIESDKIKSLINRMDKKLSYDEYVIYESKQLLTEVKIDLGNLVNGSLRNIKKFPDIRLRVADEIVEELTAISKFLDGDMKVTLKGKTDEILQALVDSRIIATTDSLPLKKYLETAEGLSNLGNGGKKSDILDVLVKDKTSLDDATDFLIDFLIDNESIALKKFDPLSTDGSKLRKLLKDPENSQLRRSFVETLFSDVWKNWDSISDSFKSIIIKTFKDSKEVEKIMKLDDIKTGNLAGSDIIFKNIDGEDRIFAIKGMDPTLRRYLTEKGGWQIKTWDDYARGAGMKGTKWKQFQIWAMDEGLKKYIKLLKYSIPIGLVGRAVECLLASRNFEPTVKYSDKTKKYVEIEDWDWLDCFSNTWFGDVDVVPDDWKPQFFTWEGMLVPGIGTVGDLSYMLIKSINVLSLEKIIKLVTLEVENDTIKAKKAFYEKLPLIKIIRSKCSVSPEDVQAMKNSAIQKLKQELGDDAPEDAFSIGLDNILGLGMENYQGELNNLINDYQNKVADIDKLKDDVEEIYETNKKYKVKVNIDEYPELNFNPDIKGNLKQGCIIGQTEAAIESFNSHDDLGEKGEQEEVSMKHLYDNSKWNLEWYTETGKLNNESKPSNVSVEYCEYNKDKFKNMLQVLHNIQNNQDVNIAKLEKTIVCSKDNMDKLKIDLENSYLIMQAKEEVMEENPDIKKVFDIIEMEDGVEIQPLGLRTLFCWERKISQYFPIDAYIDTTLNIKFKMGEDDLKNIVLNLPEGTDWKKGSNGINFKLTGKVIDTVGEQLCNCSDGKTKGIEFWDNGTSIDAYDYCMKTFKDKLKKEGIFNKFSDGTN